MPISDAWKGHAIIQTLPRSTDTTTQEPKFLDMFKPIMYPFDALSIESHVHPFYVIVNAGQKFAEIAAKPGSNWTDLVPGKYLKQIFLVNSIYTSWISIMRKAMTEGPAEQPDNASGPLIADPTSPSPSGRTHYNTRAQSTKSSSTGRVENDTQKSAATASGSKPLGEQDAAPTLDIAPGEFEARTLKGSFESSGSTGGSSTKEMTSDYTRASASGRRPLSSAGSSRTAASAPPVLGVPLSKRPKVDGGYATSTAGSTESGTMIGGSSRAPSTTGSESTRTDSSGFKGKKRKDRGSTEPPADQK